MQYFLKIDGIPGESTDAQHQDEIEVRSVAWGMSQSATAVSTTSNSSGKPAFQDLNFVMPVNRASPLLFLACATGQHIREAVLTARKEGENPLDFLTIKLSDLIVARIDETDEAEMLQHVWLDYSRIEYAYRPQRADGSLGDAITGGWDLAKNQKL